MDADLVCEYLHADGFDCDLHRVWTRDGFTDALRDSTFHLILADHQLPNFDGESALAIAREMAPHIPFVFVSGTLGEDVAVEAMKRGATDYVVKQRLDRLTAVARRALSEAAERSERQRAERALRRSEENFETLVNAMPQLCWMADPQGYITWYNRRWHEYTGTTPAEVQGWGWQSVHDPDVLPDVLVKWRASIASGERFEMTFPLKGADGVFRPFLTRAEPVRDEAGEVVRWLGTNTDVTAQYQAEEALRRLNETLEQRVVAAIADRQTMLEKMQEGQKLETIGQLTAGIAHDFNNLLTPIVGSLDMLSRRASGDERSERLIAGAIQAAERAKTLVQRLLAFGRRQVLEPRAVDIAALADDVIELIARSIGPQITLELDVPQDLAAARVDPNQLELALLNLAVNARDAMPGGGTIRIEADEVEVRDGHGHDLRHGTYVRITVSDTGAGMDEATLKRAIEPFYSTKEIGKGTGLGLSMVHGLAGQSGGALILSSQPGLGTRAEIWLPAAPEGLLTGDRRLSTSSLNVDPATILLVDDEAIVRASTAEMLVDLGHQVIEAGSAGDAETLVQNGVTPDLVITDYLMPGADGAELARRLRSLVPELPILLVTGYASIAGNTMADLPLLAKPFRQNELAEITDRLLACRRASGTLPDAELSAA